MTGLLLMAAAFLGFMWLNQPKVDPNSRTHQVETTEDQKKAMADDMLASPSDSITDAELSMLAAAIRQYGEPDSTAGFYTLKNKQVSLQSDGKTVSGSVIVDGTRGRGSSSTASGTGALGAAAVRSALPPAPEQAPSIHTAAKHIKISLIIHKKLIPPQNYNIPPTSANPPSPGTSSPTARCTGLRPILCPIGHHASSTQCVQQDADHP